MTLQVHEMTKSRPQLPWNKGASFFCYGLHTNHTVSARTLNLTAGTILSNSTQFQTANISLDCACSPGDERWDEPARPPPKRVHEMFAVNTSALNPPRFRPELRQPNEPREIELV